VRLQQSHAGFAVCCGVCHTFEMTQRRRHLAEVPLKIPSLHKLFPTPVAAAIAAFLAGCSSAPPPQQGAVPSASVLSRVERADTTPDATSTSRTVDGYKRDIALRISEVNSTKVYEGQPQALLRSIIVVKFSVDGSGKLLRSEIVRTNHDSATEATALGSLRNTAPFPKPASHLLRNGKLEMSETWLFNNDGRFQIRSVAQAQMSQ
jgi:protein TonB